MTSRFGKTYSRKGGNGSSKFDEVFSNKRTTLSTKWGETTFMAKLGQKRPNFKPDIQEIPKKPKVEEENAGDPFGFDSDDESLPVSSKNLAQGKGSSFSESSEAAQLEDVTSVLEANNKITYPVGEDSVVSDKCLPLEDALVGKEKSTNRILEDEASRSSCSKLMTSAKVFSIMILLVGSPIPESKYQLALEEAKNAPKMGTVMFGVGINQYQKFQLEKIVDSNERIFGQQGTARNLPSYIPQILEKLCIRLDSLEPSSVCMGGMCCKAGGSWMAGARVSQGAAHAWPTRTWCRGCWAMSCHGQPHVLAACGYLVISWCLSRAATPCFSCRLKMLGRWGQLCLVWAKRTNGPTHKMKEKQLPCGAGRRDTRS